MGHNGKCPLDKWDLQGDEAQCCARGWDAIVEVLGWNECKYSFLGLKRPGN